jgi:hypothetical protein
MSALPNGYIDTGKTVTWVMSFDFEIQAGYGAFDGGFAIEGAGGAFGGFRYNSVFNGVNFTATLLDAAGAPYPFDTKSSGWHTKKTASKSIGPLRLGVSYDVDTGAGLRSLRYVLFADTATQVQTIIAGVTVENDFPYAAVTAVSPDVGAGTVAPTLLFFLHPTTSFTSAQNIVRISGISALADASASTLSLAAIGPASVWPTTSASSATANGFTSPALGLAYFFGPSFKASVDLDCYDASGASIGGYGTAQITSSSVTVTSSLATPSTTAIEVPNTSWDGGNRGNLQAALSLYTKAVSEEPDLPEEDFALISYRTMPKAPDLAPQSANVLTLTISDGLDVVRSTNAFVAGTHTTVSGGGGVNWTVAGGVGQVSRTLLSYWRNWNTLGDPKYHADDQYTTTAADYYGADGQDRWGWGLFAYLDVTLTAPSNGSVTLSVGWVGKNGTDYTRSYDLAVTAGSHTYRVDLLFPKEGGPFYQQRVDSIAFSGLAVGSWTFTSAKLAISQQAYVKLARYYSGAPGVSIAVDGSYAPALWGYDTGDGSSNLRWFKEDGNLFGTHASFLKTAESGVWNGEDVEGLSPTAVNSRGGSLRLDGTFTALQTEMNRMEGLSCTRDETALDIAFSDGSGNTFGTQNGAVHAVDRYASFTHPLWPHLRVTKNTATALPASLMADIYQIVPMPAGVFKPIFRQWLGCSLEALAVDPTGARAGAGSTVKAHRALGTVTDPALDPIVGTGTTDASGFVTVPIRTGTVITTFAALEADLGRDNGDPSLAYSLEATGAEIFAYLHGA